MHLKWTKLLTLLIFALITAVLIIKPAYSYWEDKPVWGAWISPDWFFPGTEKYSEYKVRQIVRQNLEELKKQGINNIFLETYLRGYSIAAVPDKNFGWYETPSEGFIPKGQLPIYRHLNWSFRVEVGKPMDTLQVFIDEAAPLGIDVHAWVHVFYWKMDNRDIVLPWHTGMTIWNPLLVEYFEKMRKLFESKDGVASQTAAMLKECSALFSRTYDDFEFEKILHKYHIPNNGKQLGSLITYLLKNGGEKPDFLLMGTIDDPFPAAPGRHLGAIYLNPENKKVQETLISVFESIAKTHRGLAGIHLDHIRYAVDYQGFPDDLQKREWETVYFNQFNADSMALFSRYDSEIKRRRTVITNFVNRIVDSLNAINPNIAVSSAVLPINPPVNDSEKVFFFNKNDFAGQDWYRWSTDFVVPMMYGYVPWRIRQTVGKWFSDLHYIYGDSVPVRIFPGISHLQKAKLGLLDADTWVFFDLTLARDVRFEKKASDDILIPKENQVQ